MKMLGAALLFFSGVWLSSILIKREEQRVLRAASLARLVEHAKNGVENYSASASVILRSAGIDLLRDCGYRAERVPESFLELYEGCDIDESESEKIFFELARDFGKSYRAAQTQKCEAAALRLKARVQELECRLGAKRRLIRCVCISLSLLLVILLL